MICVVGAWKAFKAAKAREALSKHPVRYKSEVSRPIPYQIWIHQWRPPAASSSNRSSTRQDCVFDSPIRYSTAAIVNPCPPSPTKKTATFLDQLIALYRAKDWSSASKGALLQSALLASHSLITAWESPRLIGLGNAISDNFLVVYYPHLLILPKYQNQGVGSEIMRRLKEKYATFHMYMLVADAKAIEFYQKCGFTRAGKTEPMWIYAGHDH